MKVLHGHFSSFFHPRATINASRAVGPKKAMSTAIASGSPAAHSPMEKIIMASLMALGFVPPEPVHHPRLGNAQRQPILHVQLQRDVELRRQFLLLFAYVFPAIDLHLESELSDQRLMLAASAPQPDVARANQALSEVELTKRQQHLFDDSFVHQGDLLVSRLLDCGQRREYSDESGHRCSICLVHLAQSELAVVRVEDTISADLVL